MAYLQLIGCLVAVSTAEACCICIKMHLYRNAPVLITDFYRCVASLKNADRYTENYVIAVAIWLPQCMFHLAV
jgi:hypothetical protein